MDRGAACKIERSKVLQKATAPDHVGEWVIYEGRPKLCQNQYFRYMALFMWPTKMKGIKGNIRPLSQAPPTAIAQTVAWKMSWKKLNKIAGMVPTGSESTLRWKA
jgi:hypothetical protein